jgi:uncharacterized protein (DUF4415 family)
MGENDESTMRRLLEDDAPPWNDDVWERAEIRDGARLIRAATGTLTKLGRPKADNPKRQVTLRLDGEILDHFRASGPGWQGRINAILKKAVSHG